jgi:hypothetical protein
MDYLVGLERVQDRLGQSAEVVELSLSDDRLAIVRTLIRTSGLDEHSGDFSDQLLLDLIKETAIELDTFFTMFRASSKVHKVCITKAGIDTDLRSFDKMPTFFVKTYIGNLQAAFYSWDEIEGW